MFDSASFGQHKDRPDATFYIAVSGAEVARWQYQIVQLGIPLGLKVVPLLWKKSQSSAEFDLAWGEGCERPMSTLLSGAEIGALGPEGGAVASVATTSGLSMFGRVPMTGAVFDICDLAGSEPPSCALSLTPESFSVTTRAESSR